jgi:hypothetical protein
MKISHDIYIDSINYRMTKSTNVGWVLVYPYSLPNFIQIRQLIQKLLEEELLHEYLIL